MGLSEQFLSFLVKIWRKIWRKIPIIEYSVFRQKVSYVKKCFSEKKVSLLVVQFTGNHDRNNQQRIKFEDGITKTVNMLRYVFL